MGLSLTNKLNLPVFQFCIIKVRIYYFSPFCAVSTYEFQHFGPKACCVFVAITRIAWLLSQLQFEGSTVILTKIILNWWKYAEILCHALPWSMALQDGQCHLFAPTWSFQNKFMFWTYWSVNRPQGATTTGANLGYVPQLISIQSSPVRFFFSFFLFFNYLFFVT